MKDRDAFCPLLVWLNPREIKGFAALNPWTEGSWKRRVSHRNGFVRSQGDQHTIASPSRGTASGRGDWGTVNWSLWARTHLNMSEESITFILENWNLCLQMTAQLFGALIRQSLTAVKILLIYYWTEKEKTSAKLRKRLEAVLHIQMCTQMHELKICPCKINTSRTYILSRRVCVGVI